MRLPIDSTRIRILTTGAAPRSKQKYEGGEPVGPDHDDDGRAIRQIDVLVIGEDGRAEQARIKSVDLQVGDAVPALAELEVAGLVGVVYADRGGRAQVSLTATAVRIRTKQAAA